jgi:hypothetical protein
MLPGALWLKVPPLMLRVRPLAILMLPLLA